MKDRNENCTNSQLQDEPKIVLDGELHISDYIGDAPLRKETDQELQRWAYRQREITRTRLATGLLKFFGCSLGVTFLLMSLMAFNANVDKTLVKNLIEQIFPPQVTLLGVALGFYFGSRE